MAACRPTTRRPRGDISAALVALEGALTLAEPVDYVRLYVDEGLPMVVLLNAAVKRGITPAYARHLLTASGKLERSAPAKEAAIEPLSEREHAVLRLLAPI